MQGNNTDKEMRYARLLDGYRTNIVGFCARHSDSREDAEDMMQEVMIALWVSIGDLGSGSTPQQVNRWLHKVMRTVLVRRLRSSHPKPLPLSAAGEPAAADNSTEETVEEMLAHLSPGDRELVQQRLQGYDNSEIAKGMEVSSGIVNLRFFRIMKRLKKIYLHIYGK